jgi:hypothetical protein
MFVIPSDESNPEAVKRDYETRDGQKGSKWELQYEGLSGRIEGLTFDKGNFGERLKVLLVDVDERMEIQIPVKSDYFVDFAKRLPNVDLSQEVELKPFSIEKEPNAQGKVYTDQYLVIYQNGEKVDNYFYKPSGVKGQKGTTLNGFPEYDGDDWEFYSIQRRKFLKKKIEGLASDITVGSTQQNKAVETISIPAEIVDEPDDLPF